MPDNPLHWCQPSYIMRPNRKFLLKEKFGVTNLWRPYWFSRNAILCNGSGPEGSSPRLGRVCRDVAGRASTQSKRQKFPSCFTLPTYFNHKNKHRLNTFKSQPRNHTSYPAPDLITLKPHRYCLNVAQQFSKYIYTNIEEERAFPEQQEGSSAPCVWWMHSSKQRRNVR